MNEPDDKKNDLDNVAETLARVSDIKKDIVIKNIDKTHTFGKIDKNGPQRRIVKFTTDSFKEKVFKKHKKNKTKKKNHSRSKEKETTNQC